MKVLLALAFVAGAVMADGIKTADQFAADCTITVSTIPIPITGHLNFDYTNQRQLITQKVFGQTMMEIDLFNDEIKHVYQTFFGQTVCNTCYLKPPLFPMWVPPTAVFVTNETLNGVPTQVYGDALALFGLNATYWVANVDNANVVVKAVFDIMGAFTTTISLANVVPGVQDPSLFVPPPQCPAKAVCRANLNVALVLDGSGSIAAPDFASAKNFMVNITQAYKISGDKVAMGVIQFASNVQTAIALSSDSGAIVNAIQGMRQLGSGTATGNAIVAAQAMLGTRQADGNLMIIITDGQSNEGTDPVNAASNAKAMGIEVFCIGVGSGADFNQLNQMASEPVGLHVFKVSDFASLQTILQTLSSTACPNDNCNDFSNINAVRSKIVKAMFNRSVQPIRA